MKIKERRRENRFLFFFFITSGLGSLKKEMAQK